MKILLYSHLFYPSLGGIETISEQMALRFTELGHQCTVVTSSSAIPSAEKTFSFPVVRKPGWGEKMKLVREHDVVYSNGASMELFGPAVLARKPFIWTHQGYQLSSLDGSGWYEGEVAPLTPLASFLFHLRKGRIGFSIKGLALLEIRRLAAQVAKMNVAVTGWVSRRQQLPRQVVAYTPYRTEMFSRIANEYTGEYEFFYVGRLVSEKGVATLLRAFQKVLPTATGASSRLLVIGDGEWRSTLEDLAADLGIRMRVDFVGRKSGEDLLKWVTKGKIAIIPSEWEEPMGGVGLEMLAAGRLAIVSRRGGLAECVGEAGLNFENGDHDELAAKMIELRDTPSLQQKLRENSLLQLRKFDELDLSRHYVELFQQILGRPA